MDKPIDKTNKKNIYCAHCEYWSGYSNNGFGPAYCNLSDEEKDYWHRCKRFEWKKYALYKKED